MRIFSWKRVNHKLAGLNVQYAPCVQRTPTQKLLQSPHATNTIPKLILYAHCTQNRRRNPAKTGKVSMQHVPYSLESPVELAKRTPLRNHTSINGFFYYTYLECSQQVGLPFACFDL